MGTIEPQPRRIVVSGASGYLAGVVARGARKAGLDVSTVGRGNSDAEGHYQCPDLIGVDELARYLERVRPDVIFHGAGSADVRASFEAPAADLAASLGTWGTWLEAARLWGGQPLMIFPSSAAVYGAPESLPIREATTCNPISPYGTHKRFCENLAVLYHNTFDVPTVVLRLFSVFGPTQHRLLVWELYRRLQGDDAAIEILGTGKESRDFLFENDFADAVLEVSEKKEALAKMESTIFNLAPGEEITVLQMATLLRDRLGDTRKIACRGEERKGDPVNWCADNSRFRALCPEWRPTALGDAIDQTLVGWRAEIEGSDA